MIKAIIFDLDGVLVDSEPIHFKAHRRALDSFGIHLTLDDYMDFGVAKGDLNLYTKASQKYVVAIDFEKIASLKKELYKNLINEKSELMDGVIEVLETLSQKYILAIASSGEKSAVSFILQKFDIEKYFDFIVTGNDVEKVKPNPDIYLKVVELMDLKKEECIAIEDSESGLIAAKEAGIKCVVVPCDFTKAQDFSRADIVIDKLSLFNPENL